MADTQQTTPQWPPGCAELDQTPGPVARCTAERCICHPETNAHQMTITLKPGMAALLRGLAQRQGRTVEWTAHEAIRRWLHAETAALHADDDKPEAPHG